MTITKGDLAGRVPAGGMTLRLRALVAMGHSQARIARAMDCDPKTLRRIVDGTVRSVSWRLASRTEALFEAWWDLVPPERTKAERTGAERARRRAEQHGWCCPVGLDDDLLDTPGYEPQAVWRRADGTGIATDDPLGLLRQAA